MLTHITTETSAPAPSSPLMLSDHLITLAQEADRAGYTSTARRLLTLACSVFDEPAKATH